MRLLEDYSDKAPLSAIAAAIEFSKTVQETESQFDHDSSESDDDYGSVQNPMRAMIVSNKFLKALPECPTIHWPTQMFNDPQLCFCSCSTNTKPWRKKMKVSIHPNHGCKSRNMTPNQLINHLKNKEDSTHKAILVYLTKLASFQQGPARKNPAKNSFYTVPPPQPFPMTQANGLDNEVNVNKVGGGDDGPFGTKLASTGTMSHINGEDD